MRTHKPRWQRQPTPKASWWVLWEWPGVGWGKKRWIGKAEEKSGLSLAAGGQQLVEETERRDASTRGRAQMR